MASQSMDIISLSLNMSLESMLLPRTLCLKQRQTADPKHAQHAAIISTPIPSANNSANMEKANCCIHSDMMPC